MPATLGECSDDISKDAATPFALGISYERGPGSSCSCMGSNMPCKPKIIATGMTAIPTKAST
eukprot:968311-Amphidinium_carterae.1